MPEVVHCLALVNLLVEKVYKSLELLPIIQLEEANQCLAEDKKVSMPKLCSTLRILVRLLEDIETQQEDMPTAIEIQINLK